MSENGAASTKTFLVGLGLMIAMGAFIGLAMPAGIDLKLLLLGWGVILVALYILGSWRGA